jgi:hypothetical protein
LISFQINAYTFKLLPCLRSKEFTSQFCILFWLDVLGTVVRLALADSIIVLLAYSESLRLINCKYFALISPWAVAQPNSLARRSHRSYVGFLDSG